MKNKKPLKSNVEEMLNKLNPQSFITDENRAQLEEMDEKMRILQREFKIMEKKSWDSAAKVILNS